MSGAKRVTTGSGPLGALESGDAAASKGAGWVLRCLGAPVSTMPTVTQIRVRYKDTDTMSVVYYGNYLTYFEVGRVEYLREHGMPMSEVDRRVHMPVVEAFVEVRQARRGSTTSSSITSRVSERKRASFTFAYEIRNEAGELVATGFTRHACWDPASARMIAIPEWLRAIMPEADLDPPS